MRPLERFFYHYGKFLARHPTPFIVIPTLLTISASYGLLFFHSQDDIWDIYAPTNALSRVEENALARFEYASGSHHHRMQILVRRRDGASLLTNATLTEIGDTHRYIADNITVSSGNQTFTYKDLCGIYCNESNGAVVAFLRALLETDSQQLSFTFPNAHAFNAEVFIGYSIGDLTLTPTGEVKEARLFILHYMVDRNIPSGRFLANEFEMKLRALFENLTEKSPILTYSLLSRTREIEEQRRISLTAVPYLAITGAVLLLFMIITLVDVPFHRSQHLESVVGVVSPLMALYTTTGFLWSLGVPFSNILTVVPFLVATIGIDDAFLILAGWRQSTVGASLEERMGQSIAISGASVSVTSVTDVLCFGIGLFSNMPVVQLFCLYTSIALAVDFVYQLTLFTAIVSIICKRQLKMDEKYKKESGVSSETSSLRKWKAKFLESTLSFDKQKKNDVQEVSQLEAFVRALHTFPVKFGVIFVFLLHIGVSSYLATKVSTEFDMENLYLEDSPLTDISRRMQNFVLNESFIVNYAVYPMPNFEKETIRTRFEEMVSKLENIKPFSGSPTYTNLWTRRFSEAIAFWGEDETMWAPENLLGNYREYDLDEKYITVSNKSGTELIDGFFFTIVYHNMTSFLDTEDMMEIRRSIIKEYPEFTVHGHHPFEKVPTESAAAAPVNFYQTAVSAVILMSLLVLLFVMDFEAIISVVISIISICVGIVGYLHVWGVHLDAVSLISILMSVGFSVDYSAHVCYHYFAHSGEEEHQSKHMHQLSVNGAPPDSKPKERATVKRIMMTLGGVGWPVVQSGLSTLVGMFPLMFVHAYVVAVFWKTIILVSILGMFHALLLLPILFIITDDIRTMIRRCMGSKTQRVSQSKTTQR